MQTNTDSGKKICHCQEKKAVEIRCIINAQ